MDGRSRKGWVGRRDDDGRGLERAFSGWGEGERQAESGLLGEGKQCEDQAWAGRLCKGSMERWER